MKKIEIKNLNFKYGNTFLFKNLNLDINSNSYTTIIGPVGSGKTTLFNQIINNNKSININGNIKYIVTDPNNQIVAKTVRKQLSFFLENEGFTNRQINIRTKNIIKKFGLESILDKDPFYLSEGEKQLVVICSILVLDLDILVIDNALCRLDSVIKDKVLDYLIKLKKKKVTIINFTSDINEILLSDYIVLINKKVIFDKKAKEAFDNEKDFIANDLQLPFMIELSNKLKYYNLLKFQEIDMSKMVDILWK